MTNPEDEPTRTELRKLCADLFPTRSPDEPPPNPTPANDVPNEGNNPAPGPISDDALNKEFMRALMNGAPQTLAGTPGPIATH